MRVNPFYATTVLIAWSLFGLIAPASATCTWYPLTNGTTADATQVMADFNCLQGNVEIDNGSLVLNGYEWSQGPNAGYAFWDRTNANNAWTWYSTGSTAYLWKNFNTVGNVVSVDQNGDVGIGTSTPSRRLTVYSTNGLAFKAENNGTGNAVVEIQSDNNAITGINFNDSAGGTYGQIAYYQGSGNNYMTIVTNAAERVRINSSGNVGIGTTTPSYLLQVNGNAFANSWQTPSDARLKKNISPISGAMDTIKHLKGVHFEWRNVKERSVGKSLDLPADKPQVGFIAQEVRTVLPEAVSTARDGVMSLQESKVVPILVEAVKGLNNELDRERSEYNRLKAESDRQNAVVVQLQHEVAELKRRSNFASTGTGTVLQRLALSFGWY